MTKVGIGCLKVGLGTRLEYRQSIGTLKKEGQSLYGLLSLKAKYKLEMK